MTFAEEHQLETYKSLVTVSMEGLKAALLINGGAIVALLAFMGQSEIGTALANDLRLPIAWFGWGVVLSALAFLCSYFTQLALYNERFPGGKYWPKRHRPFLMAGVLAFLATVILFGCGSYTSIDAFAKNIDQQGPIPSEVFVLYRNSVTDQNMRIHVATFDADSRPGYNAGNCDQAQKLFQAQPSIKTKFWCEKGRFEK